MQVSSPLLNITLSHSRATGDSLGRSRVWCKVFRTNIAPNHKLINNFHKRNSKLWQQICFCTQCDYWKNHGDKWTWEIMKLMTQPVCVCTVLLGWLALVMRHWCIAVSHWPRPSTKWSLLTGMSCNIISQGQLQYNYSLYFPVSRHRPKAFYKPMTYDSLIETTKEYGG